MFKKIIGIFFFGSIFISLCAVALCIETNLLLHLPLNSISFYLFVFGATLLQYNLHYLFKITASVQSGRFNWSEQNRYVYKLLIAFAIALIMYSLFSFQFRQLPVLVLFGIIAFVYSFPILPFKNKKRIKDFGLLKIITLALLWTLVTVWFPVEDLILSDLSLQLIFLRRFVFIFLLCLLFDIRDIDSDKKENIKTLAVKLGIETSYRLCFILLLIFIVLSVIQLVNNNNLVELVAMLLSAAATAMVILYTRRNKSDYVYMVGVDGMMLLQALLVITGSIYLS